MARTIITHDGKFHADDVFAVATLLLLYKDAIVIRTRDADRMQSGDIVLDVGGIYNEETNRFDHHQAEGAGERGNNVPFAAFGLVWRKFGEKLVGNSDVAKRVDDILVTPIDANDNGLDLVSQNVPGLSPYEIGDMVRAFIPTWLEKTDMDAAFIEVVEMAKRVIIREVKRAEAVIAGRNKVHEAYANAEDKRLVILDGDFSWKDTLAKMPEPLYVVHPQNATWRLYCVRDNPNLFVNRRDLPEAWAGLREQELAKVTGVPDAIFCHRNRFMAVAKTKEGALALARKALAS